MTLAKEAARRGKLYSTHMRDEGDSTISLFGSIEETLAIGRLSGGRVQISHLKCAAPSVWGRTLELLDRLLRRPAPAPRALPLPSDRLTPVQLAERRRRNRLCEIMGRTAPRPGNGGDAA